MRDVAFAPTTKRLGVEVIVGRALPGAYRIYLWDRARARYRQFGAGVSTDEEPDHHLLPGVARTKHESVVEWNVLVSGDPGARYDVTVRITGDGKPLAGGEFRYSGELAGPSQVIADLARLVRQR